MIEAGTVLQDRYRVQRQIGQGGMGAVYVATDMRFESTVAIKETLFMDEKFRRAFEREARLLNSLRHPALPRVSDHFIEGNGQFLVMEYIPGEDLSEQLEHDGRVFSLSDVLDWADQLLDALEFLHGQETPVIHRDIKPQNLKLTARGQIILLDFGLAKGNITSSDSPTAAKSVFGYSRNYASLEQIQGTGTDPRSDLYSLAATMYHLLTGVPPADALTRAMNVLSEQQDPLIPVNKIRPEVPAAIADTLHKAMALNAGQRPLSAQAMRAMLWEAKSDGVPEDLAPSTGKLLASNIFTQKTQVQAAPNARETAEQSELSTEVLPAFQSKETRLRQGAVTGDFEGQETKVRTSGETTAGGRSRRRMAVGAGFASLLLLGSVFSAAYVFSPHMLGIERRAVNSNVGQQVETTAPVANSGTPQTAAAPDANSVVNNAPVNTSGQRTQKEPPVRTGAKPVPHKPSEEANTEAKAPRTAARVGEPSDPRVVVGEQKHVEIPPPPKNRRTGEEIPPEVWRRMTPVQRQKLREALELERRLNGAPPPTPRLRPSPDPRLRPTPQ